MKLSSRFDHRSFPLLVALGIWVFHLSFFLSCGIRKEKSRDASRPLSAGSQAKEKLVWTSDVIVSGETLELILQKHGVRAQDAQAVIAALDSLHDVHHLHVGDTYKIGKDSSGCVQGFRYEPSAEETYIVSRGTTGFFQAQLKKTVLLRKIRTLSGLVQNTLYDSILELGESPELIVAFSDIFQWDIDFFTDPQPGDRYKIIFEAFCLPERSRSHPGLETGQAGLPDDQAGLPAGQADLPERSRSHPGLETGQAGLPDRSRSRPDLGTGQAGLPDSAEFGYGRQSMIRYGRILAAQYLARQDTLTAIYFDNAPRDDGYYDLQGNSSQKTFLKSPLNYHRISSYFSGARRHPITRKVQPHNGIDFAAAEGTPVVASADGVIIDSGYDRGIGRFLKIRHRNPHYVTLFGHLRTVADGMEKGIAVKQNQVIGYVGATGLATGPHLHYTFYENGKPINPLKIKNTSGDPLLKANRAAFEAVKDEMLRLLTTIGGPESLPLTNGDRAKIGLRSSFSQKP